MDWTAFHIITPILVWTYVLLDRVSPRRAFPYFHAIVIQKHGRQHAWGAKILLSTAAASMIARDITGDPSPVHFYAAIDVAAIIAFSVIMTRKQAAWAALCVILHSAMLASHFYAFEAGAAAQTFYRWMLGVLQFSSVLTVFTATIVGRHDWGERFDNIDINLAGLRLRSWSGIRDTRIPLSCAPVA